MQTIAGSGATAALLDDDVVWTAMAAILSLTTPSISGRTCGATWDVGSPIHPTYGTPAIVPACVRCAFNIIFLKWHPPSMGFRHHPSPPSRNACTTRSPASHGDMSVPTVPWPRNSARPPARSVPPWDVSRPEARCRDTGWWHPTDPSGAIVARVARTSRR